MSITDRTTTESIRNIHGFSENYFELIKKLVVPVDHRLTVEEASRGDAERAQAGVEGARGCGREREGLCEARQTRGCERSATEEAPEAGPDKGLERARAPRKPAPKPPRCPRERKRASKARADAGERGRACAKCDTREGMRAKRNGGSARSGAG
jgi:hypothetical protein